MKPPQQQQQQQQQLSPHGPYRYVVVCIPTHSSALPTAVFGVKGRMTTSQEHNNKRKVPLFVAAEQENLDKKTRTVRDDTIDDDDNHNDDDVIDNNDGVDKQMKRKRTTISTSTIMRTARQDALFVQCHYDRIPWNFLEPLWIRRESQGCVRDHVPWYALQIWVETYRLCIGCFCTKCWKYTMGRVLFGIVQDYDSAKEKEECHPHVEKEVKKDSCNENNQHECKRRHNTNNDSTQTSDGWVELFPENLWKCQVYDFSKYEIHDARNLMFEYDDTDHADHANNTKINDYDVRQCNPQNSTYNNHHSDNNNSVLYLFVLPFNPTMPYNETNQYCPQSHRLYTDQLFTRALVQQENLCIKLQTLNAFISTLGGGYFLCRYLNTAVMLARYQRRIALALDDVSLAMKCTINEAYNYIHTGKMKRAKKLIRNVYRQAKERGDGLVMSMCRSAFWFAKRVKEAGLKDECWEDEDKENDDNLGGGVGRAADSKGAVGFKKQATRDDFLRIRMVTSKDRK